MESEVDSFKLAQGGDGIAIQNNAVLIPVADGLLPVLYVQARGCDQGRYPEQRLSMWQMVADSERANSQAGYHNSYMQLKPDPKNPYDKDAIEVLARGEAFGCMGFVAKEMTKDVRAFAKMTGTEIEDLRVAIARQADVGWKTVPLLVWA